MGPIFPLWAALFSLCGLPFLGPADPLLGTSSASSGGCPGGGGGVAAVGGGSGAEMPITEFKPQEGPQREKRENSFRNCLGYFFASTFGILMNVCVFAMFGVLFNISRQRCKMFMELYIFVLDPEIAKTNKLSEFGPARTYPERQIPSELMVFSFLFHSELLMSL